MHRPGRWPPACCGLERHRPRLWEDGCCTDRTQPTKEGDMGKTGRKRRARKKKGANHGKRPNA